MMNDWLSQYIRTNPAVQQPPPLVNPSQTPGMPSVIPIQLSKLPLDKIRKYWDEEFRDTVEDDPDRVELWFKNTIRVFDELSYTPTKCLKCVVSLLKDSTYQWWNTLISVVPKEQVTW